MRLPGRLCDVTICVSDAVRDRLVHEYHYPEGKTVTRRNGVDTERFARGANVWPTPPILAGESGPVAVCVALLVPIKRIDVLVRAMKTVVARFPECRCVVVGSGPLESQLRALTGELGLEHNVLFTGHRDDVRPYLASADIFVLPSEREGLPLSLLEAMAFGLPCVATQAGGNLEVVRDGLNGYVVPSGSIPALAGAIEGLFGDRKARARMSQNARRTVEEEFDIEKSMAGVKAAILGGV
jgi:glycosyltransferase involved in cell wall biosynthesis